MRHINETNPSCNLRIRTAETVTKLRFSCSHLKARSLKRQALVGKESLLYSGGWQPGEKADSCQKANFLLLIRGQELLKGSYRSVWAKGGGYVQSSTLSSDSHPEISHAVV